MDRPARGWSEHNFQIAFRVDRRIDLRATPFDHLVHELGHLDDGPRPAFALGEFGKVGKIGRLCSEYPRYGAATFAVGEGDHVASEIEQLLFDRGAALPVALNLGDCPMTLRSVYERYQIPWHPGLTRADYALRSGCVAQDSRCAIAGPLSILSEFSRELANVTNDLTNHVLRVEVWSEAVWAL